MRKILAVLATCGLLLVGPSVPAQAETLYRNGANKVTITAKGAPHGAQIIKARITVKKGKKTKAKNKPFYRAKKGTYSVASTIVYRPRTTLRRASASTVFAQCRVTSKAITSDRTSWNVWDVQEDGTVIGYYAGQVTVRYTGKCNDRIWVGDTLKSFVWNSAWSDDDYIMTDFLPVNSNWAALKLAETSYVVGDLAYVDGPDMTVLPVIGWNYGTARTFVGKRTVVVR